MIRSVKQFLRELNQEISDDNVFNGGPAGPQREGWRRGDRLKPPPAAG